MKNLYQLHCSSEPVASLYPPKEDTVLPQRYKFTLSDCHYSWKYWGFCAFFIYTTTIIIRRFEMGVDNQVRLDASYAIEGMSGSNRSGSARSRSIRIPVSQLDNYAVVVDAMSQALADLSKSIARDLLTRDRKDR